MGRCLQCDVSIDEGDLCLFHEIVASFPPAVPRDLYVRSDARRLIDQARAHRYTVRRRAARRDAVTVRRAGLACVRCAAPLAPAMTGRMPKHCPACRRALKNGH